jgi:hypothetical protein
VFGSAFMGWPGVPGGLCTPAGTAVVPPPPPKDGAVEFDFAWFEEGGVADLADVSVFISSVAKLLQQLTHYTGSQSLH